MAVKSALSRSTIVWLTFCFSAQKFVPALILSFQRRFNVRILKNLFYNMIENRLTSCWVSIKTDYIIRNEKINVAKMFFPIFVCIIFCEYGWFQKLYFFLKSSGSFFKPWTDLTSSLVRGLNITMVRILLCRQAAGNIGNYLMIRMGTIYCDQKVLISRTDSFINILKWTIIWSFQFKVINLMFLQWMPIEQGDSLPWPNFKARYYHRNHVIA